MLKKGESGREISLDKSWGGASSSKKPRSEIRTTVGNYNQQCFDNVATLLAARNQLFQRAWQRWTATNRPAEECPGLQECLLLLQKEQKKADNPKNRLSLAGCASGVLDTLGSEETVLLHHPTPRSELLQLVLGAKLEQYSRGSDVDTVLFTSKQLLSHYSHYLFEETESSPEQNRDRLTKIPGLSVLLYEEGWEIKQFDRPTLVFLDTLMCPPDQYLPVYRYLQKGQSKDTTLVVYSDNINGLISTPKAISLAVNYPVSVVNSTSDDWTGLVCKILKDGKLHALQTDAVIFYSSEQVKTQLTDTLNKEKIQYKIQTGTTPQESTMANIFLCRDEEELARWNYSYDNVACVYDQGVKISIGFDFDNRTYVQSKKALSASEMRRRLACLGLTRPGKYFKGMKGRCRPADQLRECDLSRYLTRMLFYGFKAAEITQGCSKQTNSAIDNCFTLLKDTRIVNSELLLERREVSKYGIRPFLVPLFLEHREPARLPAILSYVVGLLETEGCLHSDSIKQMDKIWLKNGDLSSGIEILSLLQRIIINKGPLNKQTKKEEQAPQMTQGELEMFGMLFEEIKPKQKLTITQMNEFQFLKELDINKAKAYESLRVAANIRKQFGIELTDFELSEEDVDRVCEVLFTSFNSFGCYTGSRMQGYRMSRTKRDLLPAKNSLLVKMNSRPMMIMPLKLVDADGKLSVLTSNKMNDSVFLSVGGELPVMTLKSSFGDKEIEFNNIASALFEMLESNKGERVAEFEKKHNCMVQSNHQISTILIFCERQAKDRIEKEFKAVIDRLNVDLQNETKVLTLNNLKLVCQKGGSIKEIYSAAEDRCLILFNLPGDTLDTDVRELIEEYAPVEKIEIKPGKEAGTKSAVITFAFKKDVYTVYNQLNFAQYDNHRIYFDKPEKAQERIMAQQSCLVFRWYVWKCNKQGSVKFVTAESAVKAKEIVDVADFDGKKVRSVLKDRTLQLDGLSEQTDEIFLRNALQVCGEIEEIHLDKYNMEEPKNVENLIDFYIKEYTTKDERFHIKSVKKLPQGLRVAKVGMNNPASIPAVCGALNAKKGLIGQTRLHVTPYYSHPFLVPKGMGKMFADFLDDVFVDSPPLKAKIETRDFETNGKHYIIVKSRNQDAFHLAVNLLTQKLKENEFILSADEKVALLTDQGLAKVRSLEQKFACKFVPKLLQKTLAAICKPAIYGLLLTEIKAIALQPQILRLSVSAKTARNLSRNLAHLTEFKTKFNLDTVHLDTIGKSIVMEGKAAKLQVARQNIPYFLESVSKGGEQNVFGLQTCQICCEQYSHPYRLQGCGHCFCMDCLMSSVNNSFADATTFPIRCPGCRQFLIVRDLTNLLDEAAWNKLRTIAINEFVGKNSDKYEFCFTGNCQGIHAAKVDSFECEVCQKAYCAKCKMDIHHGLTCQQAKESTQYLLKKFMEQEDIRICPNPTCKMLLQWVDGCYRVTCSRCQQSMCWKCPRDAMPIYKTAEEAYKHLTDKHGGYW